MEVIKPVIVNPGVVSGPDIKLHTNSVRSSDARKRMDVLERDVQNNVQKYSYKTKEKTPLVVKIAGAGVLLAITAGFLRLRYKK